MTNGTVAPPCVKFHVKIPSAVTTENVVNMISVMERSIQVQN